MIWRGSTKRAGVENIIKKVLKRVKNYQLFLYYLSSGRRVFIPYFILLTFLLDNKSM